MKKVYALVAAFWIYAFCVGIWAAKESSAASLVERTQQARSHVWHMQRVMGEGETPTRYGERSSSAAYRRWVLRHWRAIEQKVASRFEHPPYMSALECIHEGEGSWTDPNAPFYGGLQMDSGFQATYGAYLLRLKGTADHWTPLEQMWVAARAVRSGRGFYPWPNTARSCGLI